MSRSTAPRAALISLLGVLLILTWLLPDHPARAGLAHALPLVPPIPEADHATTARGTFYRQHQHITIPARDIWLAASPDGREELCTDDRITLTFYPTVSAQGPFSWQHRFASADGTAIECLPPQHLSQYLAPGRYELDITLDDLVPPTYGTRAYYLVFPHHATPSVEPRLPAAITPTQVLTPVTPAQVGHPFPPATSPPPITPNEAAAEPPPFTDPPGPVHVAWPLLVALAMVGIASSGLLVGWYWWQQRTRTLPLHGILDLFDRDTHESRTILLVHYPSGVTITRHPLDVVPRTTIPVPGSVLAWIVPTPQGGLLQEVSSMGAETVRLHTGEQITATLAGGAVMVRYRQG